MTDLPSRLHPELRRSASLLRAQRVLMLLLALSLLGIAVLAGALGGVWGM
jgi:hypothetical protein